MRFTKHSIPILLLFTGTILSSCEKDEVKVTFEGGTPPVLTVSSTNTVVLSKSNENFSSLQFHWTNPNFEFSNGVNTQDILYTLQVDTVGSNFSNPRAIQLSFSRELTTSFRVKELNTTLSSLELKDFMPHNFEFRIKATIANSTLSIYSNVVQVTISTYLDVVYPVPDRLFITGAATPAGWMAGGDPIVQTQEFTKINTFTFQINSLQLNPSVGFLFVPVYGNWDNKYGFTGDGLANTPAGDFFRPNGNDIISPSVPKAYKITVNFKTGRFSIE